MPRGVARWFCRVAATQRGLVLGAVVALATAFLSSSASACRLRPTQLLQIDPALAALDTTPPPPPVISSARVYRQEGRTCVGAVCTVTSCGDQASVMIRIAPPQDDALNPERIGYLLFPLDGVLPERIGREAAEIRRGDELVYRDGFDDVLATNATVVLLAVDEAGNVSDPSEPFELEVGS